MKTLLSLLALAALAATAPATTPTYTPVAVDHAATSGTANYALTSGTAATLSGTLPATHVSGLATVSTTGAYGSLLGLPPLGTAAAQPATAFDASGAAATAQAFAIQRANHTGTQPASTISDFGSAALSAVTWGTLSGKPSLATVATSGSYGDLLGLPTIKTTGTTAGTVAAGDDSRFAAVNTATQTALGLKQDASTAATLTGTQTLTHKTLTTPAISSPTGLVKGDVGLSSVDNISDANKPISTATQTALDAKATTAQGAKADAALPAASFYNSDERLNDSFMFEGRQRAPGFYPAASGSLSYVVQTSSTPFVPVQINDASTNGAVGAWAYIYALGNANSIPFSRLTVYFAMTGLNGVVGIANTGPLRLSLFGRQYDAQGTAPTAVRADLVITGSTTAHFEVFDTSLHTGTDFTIPNVTQLVNAVSITVFVKFVVTGGVVSVFFAPETASGFPTVATGSSAFAPTALANYRAGFGVHFMATGTSAAHRTVNLYEIAHRITK